MGCGKSSVGRKLSELLCCPFMDLDAVIEEQAGRRIPEIFATDGEAVFRHMELDALRSIIQCSTAPSLLPHNHVVLSLGGGAVMTPECAELVKVNTLCIYLRTSVDTLVERLTDEAAGRPLLASDSDLRTSIETLMAKRASTYEATAHHTIDTDGLSIDAIAGKVVHILK